MRNQRGNIPLVVIIIVIVVGLIIGVYLVQQRTNLLPKAKSPGQPAYQPTQVTQPAQTIQNDSDLTRVGQELDGENLDVIDAQLTQNDIDLNSF